MINISSEAKKVLETIKQYGPIRSAEIVKMLNTSTKTAYKHLAKLLDEDLIKKIGTAPMVFYAVKTEPEENLISPDKDNRIINDNYIYVSPSGEVIRGAEGFQEWCRKNQFDFKKEKKVFIEKLKSFQKFKKDGLISAKKFILSGDKKVYLNNIFFSDFYNIAHFGKTKLGQLVYLGKSSQNKTLIAEIVKITRPSILKVIKKYNIKLICFIPPTIDRKIQFVDVFKKGLKLDLEEIKAIKIPNLTKVPQKTLRKLEDRIINANKTIAVNPNQKINSNVLIIDDATGSGATLNETAGKIRNITKQKIKIVGYSVVGSYKGFDVISEV
jgi:DNA-binding Lrp family transcriptional regulator